MEAQRVKKRRVIPCKLCNSPFEPYSSRAKYCSERCREKAKKMRQIYYEAERFAQKVKKDIKELID